VPPNGGAVHRSWPASRPSPCWGLVVGGIVVIADGSRHKSPGLLSTSGLGSTGAAPTRLPAVPATSAPPQPSVPSAQMRFEDLTRPAVFPAPADVAGNVRASGLLLLSGSNIQYHFHAHLSVWLMSGPVVVPSGLGIDPISGAMSVVHTHTSSGLIHIESEGYPNFTLGQFFTEWGQPLGPN
jgi:hypothetical protein